MIEGTPDVDLTCTASSNPAATFKWYKGNHTCWGQGPRLTTAGHTGLTIFAAVTVESTDVRPITEYSLWMKRL